MKNCRRTLMLLTLGLPLVAQAQVQVVDMTGGYSQPSSSQGAHGNVAQTAQSAQGELFMQLQQMQQEIAYLRGMVEEQQNDIKRLQQEGLERYQELDSRLASGAPAAAANTDGAINANTTPTPPAQAGAQAQAEPADPAKEKLYYDAAFDLVKAKDFARANQAFSAFLRRYPQSQYAGNAQYWLGEVNLVEGNLQEAGRAFAGVQQNYPQHAKVPDALFKLADVEQRLGNADKSRTILQEVIRLYPGTSAAQLAQRNLQR